MGIIGNDQVLQERKKEKRVKEIEREIEAQMKKIMKTEKINWYLIATQYNTAMKSDEIKLA